MDPWCKGKVVMVRETAGSGHLAIQRELWISWLSGVKAGTFEPEDLGNGDCSITFPSPDRSWWARDSRPRRLRTTWVNWRDFTVDITTGACDPERLCIDWGATKAAG